MTLASQHQVRSSLEEELNYERRKGTVHFPLDKPVPMQLISRIARLRAVGISAATKKEDGRREKGTRKPPA